MKSKEYKFVELLSKYQEIRFKHIENRKMFLACNGNLCLDCQLMPECDELFGADVSHLSLEEKNKFISEYPELFI